ncbi:MAG: LuxR C-terminal-related transcriptional regulator [Bacteroidales bacterium]|nr:LuxR C-terminal-related transcriptional regulator [Bacteroidales bacterium]
MKQIHGNMKMAELVEANYHLLAVLTRFGIEGGFGEKTVREICEKNHLDTDTFLLICNVYTKKDYTPSEEILRDGHIDDILRYLHQSHDYYMSNALVLLASTIEDLIIPCPEAQKRVIWKFFSDYKTELDKHFEYEEGEVIPYVQNLLLGKRNPSYSITQLDECHANIEESLSDLKNLILKSLPAECDDRLRVRLLNYIFALQSDLDSHTAIEDNILVPMVKLIENPMAHHVAPVPHGQEDSTEHNELSDREIEILVSVAQGLLNKEIADRHNISINTVITHRKNITRKTGIKTVAGLTVYAILNGYVDINSVK